jgi:hypothetical protein
MFVGEHIICIPSKPKKRDHRGTSSSGKSIILGHSNLPLSTPRKVKDLQETRV